MHNFYNTSYFIINSVGPTQKRAVRKQKKKKQKQFNSLDKIYESGKNNMIGKRNSCRVREGFRLTQRARFYINGRLERERVTSCMGMLVCGNMNNL